ncbi:MAG: hypothetical protein A2W80_00120 [Candidatus Riflebacteria bacterium GWC2_50_8]|nr:MAG: hypothetical protein A2W80_00120 [Candidatus Riflebacteria bacterium GWC2_50_8]
MAMKQAVILIMILMLTAAAHAVPANYIDEMGGVVEEISLLNLLRGLYLSEEQAKKIAELAQEAENIRAGASQEIAQLDSMPSLTRLRDELYTALAEEPPAIRTEVVKLDNRAHEITGVALDKIARLEDEVRNALTHGQQKIVWEFVPCIVPELDFENPVRTGQAEASSRLMPALKLIRETPEDLWKRHGQDYLDHILKVTEQEVGKLTDDVREDMRRRLVKHAWKIRKMKEADFMINRNKLAEDLLLVNREHTLRSGYRITGKISRFLLSPHAARVLPQWVAIHFSKESAGAKIDNSIAATASEALPLAQPIAADPTSLPANPPAPTMQAPAASSPSSVSPVDPKSDQSSLPVENRTADDADTKFWSELVPKSLARLAETPYYNHIYHAFGRTHSQTWFDEEDKYVDISSIITGAGEILNGGRPSYYTLTPGEP